jgi:hypothetical protein
MPIPVVSGGQSAISYQQITSLSAAAGLTVPTNAAGAVITAESQGVRWRSDGTDPTASVGMPLASGASITFSTRAELLALKFIEQTTSAKLNIAYYG